MGPAILIPRFVLFLGNGPSHFLSDKDHCWVCPFYPKKIKNKK
jgi:hypothetical protein